MWLSNYQRGVLVLLAISASATLIYKKFPPPRTAISRQKPLKGGLNQLNSGQSRQARPTVVTKKVTPTNFAQAVAAAPSLLRDDQSNLVLCLGSVVSLVSEQEAAIVVPEHGQFILHVSQVADLL